MPSYGDLFFGLKSKNVLPGNPNYADHIFDWIQENMFKNKRMSCEEKKWVKKFAPLFKSKIKLHSGKNQSLEWGKNAPADRYLLKTLDIVTVACECSECVEADNLSNDVEMPSVEEREEEKTKKQLEKQIQYKSDQLRKNHEEPEIIHAAQTIAYNRSIQILKYFSK